MRRSDFILLSEEEKKWTVLHEGVLVAKRNNGDYKVFLFQLSNYYVELFGNLHTKAIDEYRVFDNANALQPYLPSISLDDLFN